jgi:predicted lipoprotein with Yx(FWY)xxD motif
MKSTTFAALGAAAALAIAGCGGTSGYAGGSSKSSGGSHASTGPKGAAQVNLASTGLGKILADSKGRSLYLFEADKGANSVCYGACASYWPPLTTSGKPSVGGGISMSKLGTVARRGGTRQVTFDGHPLYYFAGDSAAGQTNGEGLTDFGGGWDVLDPAGKKIEGGGS